MGKNIYLGLLCLLCSMVLSAQDTLKTVKAESGDGIYSLLRKQGIDPIKYYEDFINLNQSNLKDGSQLYIGRTYTLPNAPDTLDKIGEEIRLPEAMEYSIFGKELATVTPVSTKLEGTVYYLVSGHGGPDPGAVEHYNGTLLAEDEYAYDVTLRLARELLSHGAMVYVIVRDENDGIRNERMLKADIDEVVYPNKPIPLGQLERLEQRVEVVNELYLKNTGKYQRLLVTHVDSRSKGQNIDVFFYHHEKSKNGEKLAESIHKVFKRKYKQYQPNRIYEGTFSDRSSLYLVKNTLPAMAYIEIGNIRNKKDQRRILVPENRQALAKWISEGVIEDWESSEQNADLANNKYDD